MLLTPKLRVCTCIEMVTNKNSYLKKHKNTGIKFVSPDFSEAVKDCSRDKEYSSAWTIDAAATVLQRNIKSIYPPVNGLLYKTVSILNTTFTTKIRYYLDPKSLCPTFGQKTTPCHRHHRRHRGEYDRGIVYTINLS